VVLFEFRRDLWRKKTRFSGLSCGTICVILRLAVLIQYRSATDRHTTTAYTTLALRRAVKSHVQAAVKYIKRGEMSIAVADDIQTTRMEERNQISHVMFPGRQEVIGWTRDMRDGEPNHTRCEDAVVAAAARRRRCLRRWHVGPYGQNNVGSAATLSSN